jgi:hypothetical protein
VAVSDWKGKLIEDPCGSSQYKLNIAFLSMEMMRNLTNLACMRNETDISDDRFASNGMFNCREESTNRCLQVIASENSLIFSEAVPRNTMILGTSGLSYTVV